MRWICLLLLAALAGGCSGPSRTFDVSVRNDLDQPITVWLTKNGPPAEDQWLSPEELAIAENPRGTPIAGRAVAPGHVAETGPRTGHFPAGTDAILRVYRGQHTLDELLATSSRSPSRVDVTLSPGKSNLVVHERDGKLAVDPAPGRL